MTKQELLDKVREEASGYFARGEFYCSEAVAQTINNLLGKPYDENIVKMASGFPIGMGKAGCVCGAVTGGQMALGMVYGRVHGEPMKDEMFPIAAKLHDYVEDEYGSNCCRIITKQWAGDNFMSPERKKHCVEITGKVAEWVADQLIEAGKIEIE